MKEDEELQMTYSGLLMKDGEKMVRVCFEGSGGAYAEGIVPRGAIVKSSGFSAEELDRLTIYIKDNAPDILREAQKVNFLKEWMNKR